MTGRGIGYASLILVMMILTGCGKGASSKKTEVELPDWLSQDATTTNTPENEGFASRHTATPLKLNLSPGDQFPLRKIVEQELIQDQPNGAPIRNHSKLELTLAVTVQEKTSDRIKMGVRYAGVKYVHDLAGEQLTYDSSNPPAQIPLEAQAYHDMVNDGFSFWLGADNQIVEAEGLTEFVARCLRNVPESYRQQVALDVEAGSGETGIANFIDNAIGLLPYNGQPRPGDTWERTQQISRPVPMHIHSTYTLKEVTDHFAIIDIRGSIAPSTVVSTVSDQTGVQVKIDGGTTIGSCTIFRDNGLPKESRVDRVVEMTVSTASNLTFRQRKRVLTTIESYPAASRGGPLLIGEPSAQQQSGLSTPNGF